MGRIMGIDYGLRRVGVAVTDPLRIIVTPLRVVDTGEVALFLDEYVGKEVVDFFVVGMPVNLSGVGGQIVAEVEGFVLSLRKMFPDKRVFVHDERFTSKMALDSMVHFGVKKRHRANKGNIDMVSAAIILESFISSVSRVEKFDD
jgi:putative Holliday junction resolvase